MEKETKIIGGRQCIIYRSGEPRRLLLQPVDDHDIERLPAEMEAVGAEETNFLLAAFKIGDWMDELTPWSAPPTYGKQPFGSGAPQTLDYLLHTLLPALENDYPIAAATTPCYLAGYSLAGFFALWAATQTERFAGVGGASASVWFPHWLEYASEHPLLTHNIYMSIGDKERKARNDLMASNQDCMERQCKELSSQGKNVVFELNPGNHFIDTDRRMAKAFLWLMRC